MSTEIRFNGSVNSTLTQQVDEGVRRRLEQKKFSEDDISYVQNLNLFPVSSASGLDAITLERLRRVCQVWDVQLRPMEITSHRKFVGKGIVFVKRLFFPFLKIFLKDSYEQQRRFNAEVVSLLAEALQRVGTTHSHTTTSKDKS